MWTCSACDGHTVDEASARCPACGRARDAEDASSAAGGGAAADAGAAAAGDAGGSAADAAALASVPEVAIDADGVFKYVQVRVRGDAGERLLVRGHAWAHFHDDIFQHYRPALRALRGVAAVDCVGGGRIAVDAGPRRARVYGHSVGYGRCDHALTAAALGCALPGFSVSWDNEGY